MTRKIFLTTFYQTVIATGLILSVLNMGFAQVRSSAHYRLQSDSVNFGGGLSTSTSYRQESTFGEVATGESTSTAYSLHAGYQQMQEVFLSLSTTGNVVMSPNLPGLTGGVSNGSATFTVITDSPSGYNLLIKAENSPAMQSVNSTSTIADYVPVGTDADFSFSTAAGQAHFGYTPEGSDIVQAFKDNGSACNVGNLDTSLACWEGLSTTDKIIAQNTNATHPDGATTTIRFRVGIGSGAGVTSGVYIATTTVTALPL